MIETESRRLRVRDDGTGKDVETDGTLADFEAEDAIILLGDPGMGKTTLFKNAAKGNYITVRNFLIDPNVNKDQAIFLDALDEYRTIASGLDASANVAKALCDLQKPKFRLSCRAADWFGSLDLNAFRVASASGRVVVLELCPLSCDEILIAVEGVLGDPNLFLKEAESAGLGKLLGNPQTLELIARAWESDKKPGNKFEAYEIGVSVLLKETNEHNVARGATSRGPKELRKAASAAFSNVLLSNSVGISRADTWDGNGYLNLSVVPYPEKEDLDAVLARRIFICPDADRFEPIHRTIAEFLAAEDLSKRIEGGLPINRVMALICGKDGRPVSSLRGLFAWLMCRLGSPAHDFVDRDPYGIATYGDASVLAPAAQCVLWRSLRKLHDPWFLRNEDNLGSFRDLANVNTAKIIKELIQDPATGNHLKIAALEAITNSTEAIGVSEIVRKMVVAKHNNTWLRSTALRTFARSVNYDWPSLQALDCELSQVSNDVSALEVRVALLHMTKAFNHLGDRVLSIIEQAANTKDTPRIIGRFHSLSTLPPDGELDMILDGASGVLTAKSEDPFELRLLFDKWLKRRLENPAPITPMQLAGWLRHIRGIQDRNLEETTEVLKALFEQQPSLFEEVLELLYNNVPNQEGSFWHFVNFDLWQLLPSSVWPVPHSEFFLTFAEKEKDSEHAAYLFRMYLSFFPMDEAPIALAEAGIDLLNRRHDVAKALGDWQTCEIEPHQFDRWKYREDQKGKRLVIRTQNVGYCTAHLETIRAGKDESALVWAARVYQGLFYDLENASNPRERLVKETDEDIADALIEGIMRYIENPTVPRMEAVIESWEANSIPYTHTLLSLSVFLRLEAGIAVPSDALPHCIAAVVTTFNWASNPPGYYERLSGWLLQEAQENPSVVRNVLSELWVMSTTIKKGILPGFYELRRDPPSRQFLSSLSADVLKTGINQDHRAVEQLVLVLLPHDRQAALEIGEKELSRNELSREVRSIWSTALFVIDSDKYLKPWKTLISETDAAVREAIELLRGGRYELRDAVILTAAQRAEVVASVGRRFDNIRHPPGARFGDQHPSDASEFVVNHIKLLAADSSPDVDILFERLEKDKSLASYRDSIRHHRAQHQKQQRESGFIFALPEQISEAIQNGAPATSGDLLAFIIDHLSVLANELTGTQRERYRAYWNEDGRELVKPKREEVCSGLLADDLQNRVDGQSLIVTVEHHMVADKECDLVILQGTERLLPIEVKHHNRPELWKAWDSQLNRLYTCDAKASGLGIYLVLWSGEAKDRRMPKLPEGIKRPRKAAELKNALESLIPEKDRHRLRVVVIDISAPISTEAVHA